MAALGGGPILPQVPRCMSCNTALESASPPPPPAMDGASPGEAANGIVGVGVGGGGEYEASPALQRKLDQASAAAAAAGLSRPPGVPHDMKPFWEQSQHQQPLAGARAGRKAGPLPPVEGSPSPPPKMANGGVARQASVGGRGRLEERLLVDPTTGEVMNPPLPPMPQRSRSVEPLQRAPFFPAHDASQGAGGGWMAREPQGLVAE